jgi:hypothetical protein
MAMTITPHDDTEFETSGRRRKITKFALAGVAVLGVGAALTSAAWTDNVWFGGSAGTAEFELSGQDPATGNWVPADDALASIALPADALDNVGPNISDSYTLRVRNDGSIPIYLNSEPTYFTGGDLFAAGGATVDFGPYSRTMLNPGQQATVDVIVTGGDWSDQDFLGDGGTLEIQIEGSSSAPAPVGP